MWWDYLKYVVGVAMVIVGIYMVFQGQVEAGWEMIVAGLALMGVYLGLDVHFAKQKRLTGMFQ
ncbi:MAG: hypothetical protein HWN68_11130 [Desulfobacterales bacterium]|nr:hypothetical protein [Desulfobacterales bacterium]